MSLKMSAMLKTIIILCLKRYCVVELSKLVCGRLGWGFCFLLLFFRIFYALRILLSVRASFIHTINPIPANAEVNK